MIISASRRTDVPSNYADWFFNRVREGFALVRSPMAFHKVRRVDLTPAAVDGMVFWTKNPAPMLPRLDELKNYTYYFQFTLTPYGADVEPNLPSKDALIETFKRLSGKIGPDRVIWRYDPILINAKYTADFHITAFERMAWELRGFTTKTVISFIDAGYRGVKGNADKLALSDITDEVKARLAADLVPIARGFGISVDACAEKTDLSRYGVGRARCVDGQLFSKLLGREIGVKKDKNQRPACGCAASVDIGMYNTCPSGCLYCYANYNPATIAKNRLEHDPRSPFILGDLRPGDVISE